MRKLTLLAIAIVGSSLWTFAQAPSPGQSSSFDAAGALKIEGCLGGTDGSYSLQDKKSGIVYLLVGDNERFNSHVGQEVRVTGKVTTSGVSSNSITTTDTSGGNPVEGEHRLNVQSLTKLSSSCSSPL
jgi:hypothetical protein